MQTLRIGEQYVEAIDDDAAGHRRGIRWVPLNRDERGCDGVMTVTTSGRAPDRVYLVTEFVTQSPFDGRAFVCRRAGKSEPYHTYIHRDGHDTCDCAAGVYREQTPCVHRAGIRAILVNGWMPPELGEDRPDETLTIGDDTPVDPDAPEFPGGVDPWHEDYL